ncbi:tRNA-splicing endonuclease subunit Sen34-like [Liolophura sinensis]|uniref:tRNA-splicing endonuclease subunit Sen34-like n=1 Tax=Liolophura sinensis TaxID=3198878 RepID=UPI0031595DB3
MSADDSITPQDEILQEKQKICLFLAHGNIFVWNPNDVCTLRERHRIVGTLVGCLPRLPRQNAHLGIPLQLMKEEASLLLETGVCRLIDDTKPLMSPKPAQVSCFQELRRNQHQEQIEMYREERREEMRRHLPKILEGRKAKKRKLKESQKSYEESGSTAEEEEEVSFDVESVNIPAISTDHTMVQLFTENPWREKRTEVAVEWNFPLSEQEVMRCQVFRDLWERGYFLTSGCKFGGDFLVYPGDPSRYHAFFIAICIPHHKKMAAMDVVAMGRLGSNVKKTVLICSFDTEKDSVTYTSLQWTGIG